MALEALYPCYTFSTSGLPSNPVGRKINTSTNTLKAAKSLYSTEKYPENKDSMTPNNKPPSIAPGREPIPPESHLLQLLHLHR